MGKNKIKQAKHSSSRLSELKKPVLKYLICLAFGSAVMILSIALIALLYLKLESRPGVLYYLSYFSIAAGAFTVGNCAFKRFGGRGIKTGLIASIPFVFVTIAAIAAVSFSNISTHILLIIPIIVAAGAIGGIAGANTKRR